MNWFGSEQVADRIAALSHDEAHTLVYGMIPSAGDPNLVVIPELIAIDLAMMWRALEARTWGQFEAIMPPPEFAQILAEAAPKTEYSSFDDYYRRKAELVDPENLPAGVHVKTKREFQRLQSREKRRLKEEYERLPIGERLPLPSDSFEHRLPVDDGDWPPIWPEREMLLWLPEEIVSEYGKSESSVHNGDYFVADPKRVPQMLEELTKLGYCCHYNQRLVSKACGSECDIEA